MMNFDDLDKNSHEYPLKELAYVIRRRSSRIMFIMETFLSLNSSETPYFLPG